MKKLFKFVGILAAGTAAVLGGLALYKKFFAPDEDFDDMEDDTEDIFEEDLDASGRGYVSLSNDSDKEEEDVAEETEAAASTDIEAETTEEKEEVTE